VISVAIDAGAQRAEPLRFRVGERLEQHVHDPVAAESESPDEVLGAGHVVDDDLGPAGREQPSRPLVEVLLQAAAADEAGRLSPLVEQHARAGPAVGRTGDAHDRGQHRPAAACPRAIPVGDDRLEFVHRQRERFR
jgi:hypothetical protein